MQMRRRHASLLVALVLLAACGGGEDGGPDDEAAGTTTTTEQTGPTSSTSSTPPSTATTPPVDPSVVPEDPAAIDEAYVEAVLREHNRVIGDALRLQLEGADLKEIVDRYNAIYVPEVADLELTATLQMPPEEAARYKKPPGDGASEVVEVADVTPTCIAVRIIQSAEELVVDPPDPFPAEVVLRLASATERSAINPTPWLNGGLTRSEVEGGLSCVER